LITYISSLLHICHFAAESRRRSHIDMIRQYLHISLFLMSRVYLHQLCIHQHLQQHTQLISHLISSNSTIQRERGHVKQIVCSAT